MVEYYFEFVLERKVATRMDRGGSDTAVCRARTEDEALAQLLPEMRECVESVRRYRDMRKCYPHPHGILKECAI